MRCSGFHPNANLLFRMFIVCSIAQLRSAVRKTRLFSSVAISHPPNVREPAVSFGPDCNAAASSSTPAAVCWHVRAAGVVVLLGNMVVVVVEIVPAVTTSFVEFWVLHHLSRPTKEKR